MRADCCHMGTSLRRAIDSGEYLVDPDAVADAILRRARARALAARPASEVLVSAQRLDALLPDPPEVSAMSPDDPP